MSINKNFYTLVLLTGARAQMGPAFIQNSLQRDFRVVGCSRKKEDFLHPFVNIVQTDSNKIMHSQFWEDVLVEHASHCGEVLLINTIGTALATEGCTIEDINERPVLAAAEALVKYGEKRGIRVAIGQVSSIAASIFDPKHPERYSPEAVRYSSSKQRVDQKLQELDIPNTSIRPGIVFSDLSKGILDPGHDYSPEQFAEMPLHPILGSGMQVQQPVYIGDVVNGMLNGLQKDEAHLLDAVGPEVLTQEEMFQFFVELKGKKFRPIAIPYELAEVIAKHFPRGRIAPYAIDLFKQIDQSNAPFCSKKFEAVVGKQLVSLSGLYNNLEGKEVVFRSPPVKDHIKQILHELQNNPEARRDFFRMMRKFGPEMIGKTIRALF